MKKKDEEEENELFFYLSYSPHFSHTKTSVLADLINGTNLGLAGGKYFIKIVFDIKIKIDIFEISNVLNFSNFWPLLSLRSMWA